MINHFTKCIVCNHTDIQALKGYEQDYLVKCKKCAFVFSQRIPTEEELNECYLQYPRSNKISEITLSRYNSLLDKFESFRKTNRILDVGAGDGWFLAEAKDRGWEVFGTEFEDRAIQNCKDKGISMRKGKLDPSDFTSESFDILTSFEVVEHINNPVEEFTNFNTLLRSNGLAYITTPNFNSIVRRLIGPEWNVINYPEHLSYYTPSTLSSVMTRCGFELRQMSTHGVSISRINQSIRHPHAKKKADPTMSKESIKTISTDEKIRQLTEFGFIGKGIKNAVNTVLSTTRSGDGIKAYYQKIS